MIHVINFYVHHHSEPESNPFIGIAPVIRNQIQIALMQN